MAELQDDERRVELRMMAQAAVFVEICAADYETSEAGNISICSSMDISANGLQVRLDQPVLPGTILRLCAEFPDGREPLFLVGEVKWYRPDGEDYLAGFALFDSEQTDILAWKELVAARFA